MKPTSSPELFIEIGVEEMPAETIPVSLSALSEIASKLMKEAGLSHSPFEVYGTPRRLILYTPQLAAKQETRVETIIGPPKRIAYDAHGNPTSAAVGFAKLHTIPVSKLVVLTTEKGEYLSVEKKTVGLPTSALLKDLIPEIIAGLRFSKSMRWAGTASFIRPIRWIVALYNLKVVPCSFAQVSSGNRSYGHRLLAPAPFKFADFASYKKEIRGRFVLIDPSERYNKIKKEIGQIAQNVSGAVEQDSALLWQAAYSTEYPEAICGTFDRASLSIPKEIISTAMKEHQGYFPLEATAPAKAGVAPAMLPYFIAVLNNKDKKKTIQKGCERVLKARLSDARFYFEEDCKQSLSDRVPALKGVMFQDKLGTLYDKTQRLVFLSKFIAQKIDSLSAASLTQTLGRPILDEIKRVAPLCKADLVTGVVREFPSLQGVMGRILADRNSEQGGAIQEHYQPRFPGDPLPKSLCGQILSVADKLDSIVGCFGIGKVPTGSEDPYALRRLGVGVIQILSLNPLFRPFLLPDLICESVRCFDNQGNVPGGKFAFKTNPTLEVATFLKGRIASHLQSKSIRHDIIDAVLTHKMLIPLPPHDLVALADALSHFSRNPLFNPLITCYKRAARILVTGFNTKVNPALFTDKVESALWSFILKAVKDVDVHYEKPDFTAILEALATMYTPLNRFFTDVLVMDPNEEIRKNRMALLRVVVNLFDRFGDFSKIQEGGSAPPAGLQPPAGGVPPR
jgi:glycyl-tRNA synthetase beta chain